MSHEQEIRDFRQWAIQMGVPIKSIPTDDALKFILKSRQADILLNLTKQVKPLPEAEEIRQNIIINQMQKIKDTIVPLKNRAQLPEKVQLYLKHKDLEIRKKKELERVEKYRQVYTEQAEIMEKKNIQLINMKHEKVKGKAKTTVLQLKLNQLNDQIAEEERNQEKILASIPVKPTLVNSNEATAQRALEKALKELEAFYNQDLQLTPSAKDALWKKMREIFKNIPNALIFKNILRVKEEELENIISLEQTVAKDDKTADNFEFDKKLYDLKVDFMGYFIKFKNAKLKCTELEENFTQVYTEFVNKLRNHLLNGPSNFSEDVLD